MPLTRRGRPEGRFKPPTLVALFIALLAVASGCGSDDDSSSGSGSGGAASSADVEQAKAVVAEAEQRPTQITVRKPVGAPIPTGKTITFVSCGVEACAVQGPIIAEGAKMLGWKVEQVATDGTPEKIQGAIDAAIRRGSDAVILNAADRDQIARQLKEAQAKDIPVVTSNSIAEVGGGLIYNTATDKQNGAIGDYLAAEIVADSDGEANALYVNISGFQILEPLGERFERSLKTYCSSCKYDSLDVPVTALKDAPDRIVSFLRANPDFNYVALSVSDALGTGLPAAMRAAGLGDKVKIVGQGGNSQIYQELKNGNFHALVPGDRYSYDYQMLDALARHWAGVPLVFKGPPYWLMKQDNAPEDTSKDFPLVVDYKEQWAKIWGKT
jgi:ABC-type sugar transport system substrate-binding protein